MYPYVYMLVGSCPQLRLSIFEFERHSISRNPTNWWASSFSTRVFSSTNIWTPKNNRLTTSQQLTDSCWRTISIPSNSPSNCRFSVIKKKYRNVLKPIAYLVPLSQYVYQHSACFESALFRPSRFSTLAALRYASHLYHSQLHGSYFANIPVQSEWFRTYALQSD